MKTWKLVSGILSIVFVLVVLFQSCAAGLVDAIEDEGGTGGGAGAIVAILMLAGGIISIATRKGGKGGNIALIILFGLAALLGFTMHGVYSDLMIFAGWCLICAVIALIALIKKPKAAEG